MHGSLERGETGMMTMNEGKLMNTRMEGRGDWNEKWYSGWKMKKKVYSALMDEKIGKD